MRLQLIIVAVLVSMVMPADVFAHAGLAASSPSDGQIVESEVSTVKLEFSQPVRVTLVEVSQADVSDSIETQSELPTSFVETVEVEVPTLQAGKYETSWTAVSQDGHVINGTFAFEVSE